MPLAALLLDQVIALAWAFTGSGALAAGMFTLDRVIDERIQRRWVESQLRDLRTAVTESGATVERLNRRKLALNLTRSIRGLAPLILAPSTLVEPPLS